MTQTNINSDKDDIIINIHNLNIDLKNREIYLHSALDSDEEAGVDFRSAIIFEKNVRYLNSISNDPILVHMHLPGGVWEDCCAIYDTIKMSKAKIGILAYTKVESASSVVIQAAPIRVMMPSSYMLIHYGSLSIDNEHKAAMSNLQWNELETAKMIDIFAERCSTSKIAQDKNWKKMMAKKHINGQLANKSDWILTANEAVYYGFADGVFGMKPYDSIESIKQMLKKKKIS